MRVTKKILEEVAKEKEEALKAAGFDVVVSPYWAYGAYGYYFDFNTDTEERVRRQYYTGLGTKKECLEKVKHAYYEILERENYYKDIEEV